MAALPMLKAMTQNGEAAMRLAALGLSIFPCQPDKRPQPGLKWAALSSSAPEQARRWWSQHPAALPAIDCGKSGLVVIDLDRKPGGADGVEAFARLCDERGAFDLIRRVPAVATAGGGLHLIFAMPAEPIGNGTGALPAGIDIRGKGGYVIGEGAAREDGSGWYAVGDDFGLVEWLEQGKPLPLLPGWLLAIMKAEKSRATSLPASAGRIGPEIGQRERAAFAAALSAESREVQTTPAGGRNEALNRAAFNLGQMIAAGWCDVSEVYASLQQAALAAGLPQVEAAKTILSGIKAGRAQPRPPLAERDRQPVAARAILDPSPLLAGHAGQAEPAAGAKRGKLIDLSRDESFKLPDEIVRDTIPAKGVGFIGGQSGAFKTFAAIELGACLMTGEPFAGRKVERIGGVIYVAFEGAGTIAGRLKARRSKMEDEGQELPFLMLEGFGSLGTPEDWPAFAARLREAAALLMDRWGAPLAAIIIDTVAASGAIPADKENDPGAWQRVFDGLNPISDELNAPVVLIHHYGKSQDAGLRGSTNARAGADFVLAMTCDRDEITGDTANHRLALTKSRSAPEGVLGTVASEAVQIGARPDGSPVTSLVLHFDTDTKIITVFKKRRPSRSDRAFTDALAAALIDAGELVHVHGQSNAPRITAARVEHVREEFSRRYVTSTSDNKKRADTVRKGFAASLDKAAAGGRISTGAWGGTEWIWNIGGNDGQAE